MKNFGMFKENEISIVGKTAVYILFVLAFCSVLFNIYRGYVPAPEFFIVTLVGLILFLIAKFSVISKGVLVSVGTTRMSGKMANFYRLGYWLMVAGILCTFLGK